MRFVKRILLSASIVLALTASAQARCGILAGVRDRHIARVENRQDRRAGRQEARAEGRTYWLGLNKTEVTSGGCSSGNCGVRRPRLFGR